MPDKAKLKVLEDHGVRLVKTCGTCKHATFPKHGHSWGECDLATYQHEKHAGVRQMPAHLMFVCPSYESDPNNVMDLGEYARLIPLADMSSKFDIKIGHARSVQINTGKKR